MTIDSETLYQLGGLTGVGWTMSILGYLLAALGHGSRVVADPKPLLYVAAVLFLATIGLDLLARPVGDGDDLTS